MKRTTYLLVLATCLLLAVGALAMSSDNYKLDWFVPLTASGGGAASSEHYAIRFTVGQTVIGTSDSSRYECSLGYWCGGAAGHRIYLPLVLCIWS